MPVDYHAWTHRPKALGGTDPIALSPRPWIELENLGQTLASGSFKHSLFTDAWWDPGLVTTPETGGDDIFEINTQTEGADDYWELTTRVEGWFTLEYVHLWSNLTVLSSSPAWASQQIQFNTTGIHFFHDRQPGASADWTNAIDELEGYSYLHTYRTIYLPSGKIWPAMLKQVTGDDRDVSGHLKVWYEAGNFGGGGDNAGWSFANV